MAVWLTIATKIIDGVKSCLGVTFNINLRPVLIKPECSATPTPNIATSTTPSGAKPVKVFTIEDKKVARESPANRLFTTMASPVRGSIASNVVPEKSQDKNQISSMATKNIIAGSGSLLPTLSMVFRKRAIAPLGACTSLLLFIFKFPGKISR